MGTTIKIVFGGTVREIAPFWLPVVVELQRHASGSTRCFVAENPEKDLIDDPILHVAVFPIVDMQPGKYAITVRDFHQARTIAHDPDITVEGSEVAYTLLEQEGAVVDPAFQPNTFALDMVADAPFRLQESYPHVPVVVHIKDAPPGQIKLLSIEISACASNSGKDYADLPQEALSAVLDQAGEKVLQNGKPVILRFDAHEDHETVGTDPWFRLVLLHRDRFPILRGRHLLYDEVQYIQYRVKLKYRRFFTNSKRFVFRTILSGEDLPCLDGWYYGDTHYHSNFTDNPYEYGGPLSATAEAARAIGLSWVTVTDHSYGLSRPLTESELEAGNRWQSRKDAISRLNAQCEDVLLIGAEEITVKKPPAGLHLLSYDNPFVEDLHPAGFGTYTMQEAFDRILEKSAGRPGFLFAAHPASGGYAWKDEDYEVVFKPEYSELFAGLQLYNEKIWYEHTTRSSMDRDTVDPFDFFNEKNRRSNWDEELLLGIQNHWVKKFLLPALKSYAHSGVLQKCFALAGSDAHMDFNYSFRPHPAFLVHKLYDNAFGKVRTLAWMEIEEGQRLTEQHVHRALKTGATLLTDGPVAVFWIKREGSKEVGRIGDTLRIPEGGNLELYIEWTSTHEFGPVNKIAVFLGTENGEQEITDRIDALADSFGGRALAGRIRHVFSRWTTTPAYLRLVARSRGNSPVGEPLFYCVTNPIWVTTV
jgi:hypothetical protein